METSEDELNFVECPVDDCGETILLTELESHVLMHDIENNNNNDTSCPDSHRNKRVRNTDTEAGLGFDTRLPPALRNINGHQQSSHTGSPDRQESAKAGWRELLNMPGSRHEPRASSDSIKSHRRLGVRVLY
jgi:hypothetical protein